MREVNHEPWGILLIASGTRSLVGQCQTQNFAAGLKRRMGRQVPVVTAYLEVQEPSLRTVLRIIDDSGVQNWLCVPLFLFAAGYTVFDSPVWAARFLLFRRPHLNLRWMPAWGTERQLISVAAGSVYRLLLDFDEAASTVVLVGGASSSLQTFQKYRQVSRRIARWIGTPMDASILAGVGKSVYEVLHNIGSGTNSLLFVPYIAFDGLLMQNFREYVSEPKTKSRQIRVAEPLFTQDNFTRFVYGRIASWFYSGFNPNKIDKKHAEVLASGGRMADLQTYNVQS